MAGRNVESGEGMTPGARLCLIGMLCITGIVVISSALMEKRKERRDYECLVNQIRVRADTNNNGVLEASEAGYIYAAVKKSFYEKLTADDMRKYLERTRQ